MYTAACASVDAALQSRAPSSRSASVVAASSTVSRGGDEALIRAWLLSAGRREGRRRNIGGTFRAPEVVVAADDAHAGTTADTDDAAATRASRAATACDNLELERRWILRVLRNFTMLRSYQCQAATTPRCVEVGLGGGVRSPQVPVELSKKWDIQN